MASAATGTSPPWQVEATGSSPLWCDRAVSMRDLRANGTRSRVPNRQDMIPQFACFECLPNAGHNLEYIGSEPAACLQRHCAREDPSTRRAQTWNQPTCREPRPCAATAYAQG